MADVVERRQGVSADGRARTAGWLVAAGGSGLALSACLPWFSVLGGMAEVQLPTGSFVMFGAAGGLVAYLGWRILKARVSRRVMAALWVLAALAALVAISLFYGARDEQAQSAGTVSPAIGFDLGLLALVATVGGTVLLQVSRRQARAGARRGTAPGG